MDIVWTGIGLAGSVLFFGRFYVQWIAAELRRQYYIPVTFWYMSAGGALLLFVYAYGRGSPGGTFGLCFNLIIYTRNLVHIWREKGLMTHRRNIAVHVIAGVIVAITATLTFVTWHRGYANTTEFWFWSGLWAIGQGIFFLRFFIQWVASELRRRSVIPVSFWYLSLIGVVLHGSYFFHRMDWLLAFGTVVDALPYARNVWLIHRYGEAANVPAPASAVSGKRAAP